MSEDKEVISLLNDLLGYEYLQRDIYETYSYYLFGLCSPSLQKHLEEHRKEEDEHIRILQRYLMGYHADPLLSRLKIPEIEPPISNILKKDLELEKDAVSRYSEAISMLEDSESGDYTALRGDLENLLVQEQEHVHDLTQWLRTTGEDSE